MRVNRPVHRTILERPRPGQIVGNPIEVVVYLDASRDVNERRRRQSRVALDFCRTRRAVRARWWCCSVYQIGAYSLSSSNNSKNASATILNCESSDFSPPRRGTELHLRYIDWTTSLRQSGRPVELRDGESLGEKRSRPALFIAHLPSNPTQILTRAQDTKHWRT